LEFLGTKNFRSEGCEGREVREGWRREEEGGRRREEEEGGGGREARRRDKIFYFCAKLRTYFFS
jgi:hypothetical protein